MPSHTRRAAPARRNSRRGRPHPFPQTCLREDRASVLEQPALTEESALANEFSHGLVSLAADTVAGATRFARGAGRHGSFEN